MQRLLRVPFSHPSLCSWSYIYSSLCSASFSYFLNVYFTHMNDLVRALHCESCAPFIFTSETQSIFTCSLHIVELNCGNVPHLTSSKHLRLSTTSFDTSAEPLPSTNCRFYKDTNIEVIPQIGKLYHHYYGSSRVSTIQ